jgi:hypothetical protein
MIETFSFSIIYYQMNNIINMHGHVISVRMGCTMGSIEGMDVSASGPRVVSCMLRPDLEFKVKGPEDGNGRSGQLTWLYANNVGKRKAKDVHIETNIPSSLVESRLWIEAEIVKDIKELPPERPLCIGVVGDIAALSASEKAFWISFNYRGEDEMLYNERYELDL